jgi:hypothetical protein
MMAIKRFVNFQAARKVIAIGLLAGSFALVAGVGEVAAQNHSIPRGGSMPGSGSGSNSGTPPTNPSTPSNSSPANISGINRILAMYGLIPATCNVGLVQVMVSLQESVCAYPTSQFPSGTYILNQQDFSLRPFGTSNSPVPTPSSVPSTQPSTPTLPPGWPQPAPTPSPAATPPSPPVIVIGNPSQPVPADISAQISASMAGRGLTPVSCSANPGVTVVVGSYMACAYPTSAYPAGRYTLR